MSNWQKDKIKEKRRKELLAKENLTFDELVERVLELETALYPFAYVLGSLAEDRGPGTTITSKLFPLLTEQDEFIVYVPKEERASSKESDLSRNISSIADDKLHEIDYFTQDGLTITNGSQIHDRFWLFRASDRVGSLGDITMSDVRHAARLIFPPVKEKSTKSEDIKEGE